MTDQTGWHGTTIVCVRKNGKVVIAGDGQVSAGPTILKGNARKVRQLADGAVIVGFAGATADASGRPITRFTERCAGRPIQR